MLTAAHLVLSSAAFSARWVQVLARDHPVTCPAGARGSAAVSYRHLHPEVGQGWIPPLVAVAELEDISSAGVDSLAVHGTTKEQRRWSSPHGAGPTPWPFCSLGLLRAPALPSRRGGGEWLAGWQVPSAQPSVLGCPLPRARPGAGGCRELRRRGSPELPPQGCRAGCWAQEGEPHSQ